MNRVEHIEIDLSNFKISLKFQNSQDPLILHFDTPSRKFYFALIALIVQEMRQQDSIGYVNIRKYEKQLKLLDDALAESNASETIDGMWEKIRKAWHYSLPNLEEAAHFKIEGRDLNPPYEKGGKYVYECTDVESDIWANLFRIDDVTNKWRFRFALDTVGGSLTNVTIKYNEQLGRSAWNAFVKYLEKSTTKELSKDIIVRPPRKRWQFYAFAAAIAIILIVSGATILNRYLRPKPIISDVASEFKSSIAVLPFINMSEDPENDYFCDGITEELINSLGQVKDLKVISRTSAFYFKDKDVDLRAIGNRLKVDHILEGSVRLSDDDLRITAQLVNVKNDSHVWAETYDRKLKDIFNTQVNLAYEIACSLQSQLGCSGETVIGKRYTNNTEAYNMYLRGRHFTNLGTRNGNQKALIYFKKSIEIDPNFAIAYAGMADVYIHLAFALPISREGPYHSARRSVLKALDIDNNLAEAYASLGWLQTRFEWDWENAEINLKKAINLNPNSAKASLYYSSFLRATGRLDEAIQESKRCLTIDPFDIIANHQLAIIYQFAGKIDSAIAQHTKTLELNPNNPSTMALLSACYRTNGEYNKSLSLLERALKNNRKKPFALLYVGMTHAASGNKVEAFKMLNELLELFERKYFSPYMIAALYRSLGESDKAFEWLEKAYRVKDPIMFCLKTIPEWKSEYSDPRWAEMMKKMGHEG